jgi:hypothetical protein
MNKGQKLVGICVEYVYRDIGLQSDLLLAEGQVLESSICNSGQIYKGTTR